MTLRHLFIIGTVTSGAVLMAAGLVRLLLLDRQAPGESPTLESKSAERERAPVRPWHRVALLAILVLAATLRLNGLESRGMTHVEVYVPGIALPAGISEPPPRTGVPDLVLWHWRSEPHPPGYYFFMWGWTRAFGTSLFSIRFPSVVFGVASVLLLFGLARRLFDPPSALVAAALLAVNGHHVYWSQQARMYTMACALGLLSTILLIDLLRRTDRAPPREAAYLLVTWFALFTHLLSWALFAAQILCVLVLARVASRGYPRLVHIQAAILMLGTPLLGHAVSNSRASDFLGQPSLQFVRNFLSFGFLFERDGFSLPERSVPLWPGVMAVISAAALLVVAIRKRIGRDLPGETAAAGAPHLMLIALGTSIVMPGLAGLSWQRQGLIAGMGALPIITWLLIRQVPRLWPWLHRTARAIAGRLPLSEGLLIALMVSLLPFALLSTVSLVKPILSSRGMLMYTPPLVAVLGAGLLAATRRRALAGAVSVAVVGLHVASLNYFRAIPSPNDYRGLAHQMKREFLRDDLVFVRPNDWVTTPLFYDLAGEDSRLVAADYRETLRRRPDARVWVPLFSDQVPTEEMSMALGGRQVVKTLTALRARALLLVPSTTNDPPSR